MHISMAYLNEGDEVLIPNPGYPTYQAVTKLVGAKGVLYKLDEAHNWMPDFKALEALDLSKVKVMWVNYPHMPTGAKPSKTVFEELVAFGKRHNILIVNDNPYSFILNDNPTSILSVEGAKDVCLELNSLSKTFNMAGWRVGMVHHIFITPGTIFGTQGEGYIRFSLCASTEVLEEAIARVR